MEGPFAVRTRLLWLAPIVLALVAHGIGLDGEFVADDIPDIVRHPVVGGEQSVSRILDYNYMGDAVGSGANTIRPLATLVFALEWAIFGDRPWLFHLSSILWFCLATTVVGVFLRRYLEPTWACLGSAFFAVLAIHVDAVALVANRAEISSFVFAVLALIEIDRGKPLRAVALYWIALLFKESAFPVPFIAAVCVASLHGLRELGWSRRGRELAIAMAAAGLFLVVRNALLSVDIADFILAADNPLRAQSVAVRLWMPFVLLGKYLWLTLSPVGLAFDYTYDAIPVDASMVRPLGWLGFACTAAAGALAVLRWRRGSAAAPELKLAVAAVLGFFAWYGLFSNSVFLIVTLFAERLFFGPSLFFVFLLAVLVRTAAAYEWSPNVTRLAAVGGVLIGMMQLGASAARTRECRDERSLFASQVAAQPNAVKGHLYYARALAESDEHELAIWHLAVATAGRNRFPGRFEAAQLAGGSESANVRRIPSIVSPETPEAQFWPPFRQHVQRSLGERTAAALDAVLARPVAR